VIPIRQCVVECVEARKASETLTKRWTTSNPIERTTVARSFKHANKHVNEPSTYRRKSTLIPAVYSEARTTTEDFYYEYEAEQREPKLLIRN
jgi:hypothetical protein